MIDGYSKDFKKFSEERIKMWAFFNSVKKINDEAYEPMFLIDAAIKEFENV